MNEFDASTDWTISGSDGEPILGNEHRPSRSPRGVILLAHGFKGYKDYGMFPRLARECASAGLIAHRFNFSHSGMTNDISTFERPDLFERDTWNRQVEDLHAVARETAVGMIGGEGLPMIWFGHSRGGTAVLLAAGRTAHAAEAPTPAGLVTASAPAQCNPFTIEQQESLLNDGFLPSPSSRTGQILRVGRAFLQEQLDDPKAHALLSIVTSIECPVLVLHGDQDETVPSASAHALASAIGASAAEHLIEGGNHVFNTPNPLPPDDAASPQLRELTEQLLAFSTRACAR